MAFFDDVTVLLERIHHTFKTTDESGCSRAVLRATTPSTSACIDDFPRSVDSAKIRPNYPKTFGSTVKQMQIAQNSTDEDMAIKVVKFESVVPTNVLQAGQRPGGQPVGGAEAAEAPLGRHGERRPVSGVRDWRLQAEIPVTVGWDVKHAGVSFAPEHDPHRAPLAQPQPARSTLARIRQHTRASDNPYAATYAQFSGEGLDARKATQVKIWFPFAGEHALPLDVSILNTATMAEAIGYILFCYMEDRRREPKIKLEPSAFELRVAEDNGEPDFDLPAFSLRETIGKFQFDHLCLCKLKSASAKQDQSSEPSFIRVYHAEAGSTILKREDAHMTVGEVLKATLKRRRLRLGEYVLERKGVPGERLDLNMTVSELEERAGPDEAVEFVLIRKFSKRRDMVAEAAEATVGRTQVENSLTMNQAKTYFVNKHGKYLTTNAELRVDSDTIIVNMWASRAGLLAKQRKLVIEMRTVVHCSIDEKRPTYVRLCFFMEPEWKDQLYEAKTPGIARDIVDKINSILNYKISSRRSALIAAWQARSKKK